MPYRRRIHVPGGMYHVVQRGSRLHPIFSDAEDYVFFEQVLLAASRSTGARLYAYCWTSEAVYIVVEIDGASLGHFMQLLKSRYARGTQQRRGEHGYFFQGRYDSVIIEPKAYLPKLIQFIHYVPVLTGLANSPDDYPHSSHRAYLETLSVPWLHCREALQLLENESEHKLAYRQLMSERPKPQLTKLLERGSPSTPGILGGQEFVESVRRRATRAPRMTPDQVTEYVCTLLDVSRDDIQSRSRLRKLALARAAIAWHARVRGVATIAEISRYLGRASSTLSQGISLYRERCPEVFSLDAFNNTRPLSPPIHAAMNDRHIVDREPDLFGTRSNGGTSK